MLDVTSPEGSIAFSPAQFTPTENGVAGAVEITIEAKSAVAKIDAWSLDILDSAGGLVMNWAGQWPNASVTWNGSSMKGGFVSPATTYKAVATVRDEYGNSSQLKADIAVADLPEKSSVAVQPSPPLPPPPVRPGQPSIGANS